MRFCAGMGKLICDVGVVIVTVRFCVLAETTARRFGGICPMRTGPGVDSMNLFIDYVI
jgi:hypothetical protein